jgi:hypothetical protein
MNEEQIHLVEPQALEAGFRGALQPPRRDLGVPNLRGHEHLVASEARGAQAFAHRLLVLVHGRGIDMAITGRDAGLDRFDAGFVFSCQVPSPMAGMRAPLASTMMGFMNPALCCWNELGRSVP